MANLLDRASVVLTATAYNNGEALCIKPDDGSGDFTFSRNSAATRVNAQGLVENVQILSSNLVQNGDFSEEGSEEVSNGSFSQEGSEVIVNGDFATDSNWDGQATISNGQLTKNDNGLVRQYTLDVSVKSYKVIVDVEILGSSLSVYLGGVNQLLSQGVNTIYMQSGGSNNLVGFNNGANSVINSISCVEVGQNWTLGTGWSIGEDKAICDGNAGHTILTQSNSFLLGKTYKVTFDIVVDSGNFTIQLLGSGSDSGNIISSTQVGYTEYISPTSNRTVFAIRSNDGSGIGSITNISVKEVGQNWELTTGWSIGSNVITTDGTINSRFYQDAVTTIGKTYKYSFDVLDASGGVIEGRFRNGGGFITAISSEGNYTGTFVAYNTLADFTTLSGNTASFSITNISVIEITDDTNLPRINYEGFSYQDALGSELVTNGDFATDSDWLKGAGWTISGGTANAAIPVASGLTAIVGALTIGTTYKLTYTISNYSAGNIVIQAGWQSSGTSRSANGTYTEYLVCAGDTKVAFLGTSSFTGSIDNVSVKEYLGQEVVPDSGCGSWLFEPQSTNLAPYSEDFSQWLTISASATDNYATSPDGTTNASRFLTTSTGAYLYLSGISVSNSTVYTISVYAKSNGNNLDDFRIYTSLGDSSTLTATSQWQRFTYTFTTSATSINVGFRPSGSQNADILIYGYQIEQQSYATSYIPTSGATVTRNQDLCTNGGSLASINSTEGTLYFEGSALFNGKDARISLSDGSLSNRVSFAYAPAANKAYCIVKFNGVQVIQNLNVSLGVSQTDNIKVAIRYKTGNSKMFVNGVSVVSSIANYSTAASPLSELKFENATGGIEFEGKNKCLAVWKEALTDQELTELTTI